MFLTGNPYAGKSSLARLLEERLNFVYIGLGEILRETDHVDTQDGGLASSQIVYNVLIGELSKIDGTRIAIIDGWPRSMENALKWSLENKDPLCVIHLDVNTENLNLRMTERIRKGTRKDDCLEIAQKREAIYQENIGDIINYYTDQQLLYIIDGNNGKNAVLNKACNVMANVLNQNKINFTDGSILTVQKVSDKATLPFKGSAFSAGLDIYSAENKMILPQSNASIKTDLCLQAPPGCYIRIAERSGLALSHHLRVCCGVVDNDYFQPIHVILFNHGNSPFFVSERMRVAQIIITKCIQPTIFEGKLEHCERQGFGSTGY